MLVDLGRNDVNRVCRPETVKVSECTVIERVLCAIWWLKVMLMRLFVVEGGRSDAH